MFDADCNSGRRMFASQHVRVPRYVYVELADCVKNIERHRHRHCRQMRGHYSCCLRRCHVMLHRIMAITLFKLRHNPLCIMYIFLFKANCLYSFLSHYRGMFMPSPRSCCSSEQQYCTPLKITRLFSLAPRHTMLLVSHQTFEYVHNKYFASVWRL